MKASDQEIAKFAEKQMAQFDLVDFNLSEIHSSQPDKYGTVTHTVFARCTWKSEGVSTNVLTVLEDSDGKLFD